jgi:hypothetical protein
MSKSNPDAFEMVVDTFEEVVYSSRSSGELARLRLTTDDPAYTCLVSFWLKRKELPAATVNHDEQRVELHYPYVALKEVLDMLRNPDQMVCVIFDGPTTSRLVGKVPTLE